MASKFLTPALSSHRRRRRPSPRSRPVLFTLCLCIWCFRLPVLWAQEPTAPDHEAMPEKGIVRMDVGGIVTRDVATVIAGDSLFLPVIESAALFGLTIRKQDRQTILSRGDELLLEVDALTANYYVGGRNIPVPHAVLHWSDGVPYLEWEFFFSILDVAGGYDPIHLYVRVAPNSNLPVITWARERDIIATNDLMSRTTGTESDAPYHRSLLGAPEFWWHVSHQTFRSDGGNVSNSAAGLMNVTGAFLMGQAEIGIAGRMNSFVDGMPDWDLYYWRWTYSNPFDRFLSLLRIGHVAVGGRSMTGISLSNQPLIPRTVHGVIAHTGEAEPGTRVSLIRQGATVARAVVDPSGSYQLDVPVGYGTSFARLRYESADGSVREESVSWTSAAGMIPAGNIDYDANAGVGETQSGKTELAGDATLRAGITSRLMLRASISGAVPLYDTAAESGFSRTMIGMQYWMGRSSSFLAGIDPRTGMMNGRLDLGAPGEPGLSLVADSIRLDGPSAFAAGAQLPVGSMSLAGLVRFSLGSDGMWDVAPYGTFGIGFGNASVNLSAYTTSRQMEGNRLTKNLAARLDVSAYALQWLPVSAGLHWRFDPQLTSDFYLSAVAHLRNGWRVGASAFVPTTSFDKATYTLRLELPIRGVRPTVLAAAGATYSSLSTSIEAGAAIGPLGLTMVPIGQRGQFSIIISGFDDRNRNGKKDAGERDLGPVDAEILYDGTARSTVNGVVRSLPPYRRIRIEIDRFGFVRDGLFPIQSSVQLTTAPSGITRLEIPFAQGRDVIGTASVVTSDNIPDPQASSLLTALYVSLRADNGAFFDGEIFSDGTLYIPGVAEGTYMLYFDRRQLDTRELCTESVPEKIIIDKKAQVLEVVLRRCGM